MGWNFDDDWVYVPRNIFRKKDVKPAEPEVEAARAASTVPPAEEWRRLGEVLFRVLKGFPDAYHAVLKALRELKIELQQPAAVPLLC
jgi:hypothetical protein